MAKVLVFFLGAWSSLAFAQSNQDIHSTNFWLFRCQSGTYTTQYTECLSYFQGWQTALILSEANSNAKLYCMPSNVTYAQAINIVNRYGQMNPQFTHLDFGLFIAAALNNAFPCPGNPSTTGRKW